MSQDHRTGEAKEPGAKRCHVKCNNAAGCVDEPEQRAGEPVVCPCESKCILCSAHEERCPSDCVVRSRCEDALQKTAQRASEASLEGFRQTEPDPYHSMLHCPCGTSFTWTGYDPKLAPWMALHRSHQRTNEACIRCGGAGVYLVENHGPQEVACECADVARPIDSIAALAAELESQERRERAVQSSTVDPLWKVVEAARFAMRQYDEPDETWTPGRGVEAANRLRAALEGLGTQRPEPARPGDPTVRHVVAWMRATYPQNQHAREWADEIDRVFLSGPDRRAEHRGESPSYSVSAGYLDDLAKALRRPVGSPEALLNTVERLSVESERTALDSKDLRGRVQRQRSELKRKSREVTELQDRLQELRMALWTLAASTGDKDLMTRMRGFLYARASQQTSETTKEQGTK